MSARLRAVACAATVLCLIGVASPAAALPTTEVVQGQFLRIVSTADWDAAAAMPVGTPLRWDLTVSADAPSPGTVRIALSARGSLPLVLDARSCAQPWAGETCPSGVVPLREAWLPPLHGDQVALVSMADTDVVHLRLDVRRIAGAGEGAEETTVRVYASGAGEEVDIGPEGGELAGTGMSPIVLLAFGGAVALLIVCGILLLERSRRRARGDSGDRS